MLQSSTVQPEPRGQIIVVAGLVMGLVLFAAGLVIDGGTGLAQRRAAQNASDFGALAGARVIAQSIGGDSVNGTDANVKAAITNAVVANGGIAPTYGAPDGPRYVNDAGALLDYVGSGSGIPTGASGVQVTTAREWEPFFLGLFGFDQLDTAATAVAKGGFSLANPPAGTVFPAGIAESFFTGKIPCGGEVSVDPTSPCYPQNLTPGALNVPGGFGWLKFGSTGACDDFGLGMIEDGCENNTPFLNEQIGPPGNSFGCCTRPSGDADLDRIGSLPGNKASADCSYYVDTGVTVTVPVWDYAGGTGANAWYHIVGFAGFQITGCPGAKNLEGIWRQPMWQGPVSSTAPGGSQYQALGVQLIR